MNKKNEESFAREILHDYKSANIRQFIINILLLFIIVGLVGHIIYLHNDIGTIDTTITQENDNGYNNYIGSDGEIIYGETND